MPASALGQIVFGSDAEPFDPDACMAMGMNLVVDALVGEMFD